MQSPTPQPLNALEWTLEMVRIPSVTGSSAEGQFAALMREKLARVPYFQSRPRTCGANAPKTTRSSVKICSP